MIRLHNAKKLSARLESGEMMHYLPLPHMPYSQLKSDFRLASHLDPLKQLDLSHAGSVLIKCHHPEDGLLAASYIYKKHEEVTGGGEFDPDWDNPFEQYAMGWEDDDGEEEEITPESFIMRGGRLVALPVISMADFLNTLSDMSPFYKAFGATNTMMERDATSKDPYWLKADFPLVIESRSGRLPLETEPFAHFERQNRFLIYICAQRGLSFHTYDLERFEKVVLFETNMEVCTLDEPSVEYYERILSEMVKGRGFRISKEVKTEQVIKDLMQFRGVHFRSSTDVETLVHKVINKKRGRAKTLTNSDFAALLSAGTKRIRPRPEKEGERSAVSELEQLIGMEEVKTQLLRIVKRLKFDHMRKASGFAGTETHLALVFMGHPGTAKTTVARIFGKMLREEGVLAADSFPEVSRKDLIGQYLGQTAPKIEELFMECKGGTIFVDEAYSLMGDGRMDLYAEEAMAEFIRQMENNPDTLVIFAGYPDKMARFLQDANPGLRSRLTHVIEFKDYSAQQLWDIFQYFVGKEGFTLECLESAQMVVHTFLDKVRSLPAENLGNGRLMRRLFHAAVSYMAERDDHDLRTMRAGDIAKAAEEIWKAEAFIDGGAGTSVKIGFC